MTYWTDKNVLITGGSSGLGRALAMAFVEAEANVLVVARTTEKLRALCDECEKEFGRAPHFVAADLTIPKDVDRIFEFVDRELGGLDVLVNNVGKSSRGRVLETADQDFQSMWELNFLSVTRCSTRAAESLIARRGHIVNIGSLASKATAAYLGAYPATKFAVAGYSQQLRLELEPQGVHVLLVCPGPLRRTDEGTRYQAEAQDLPASASKPGGGVRVKGIVPERLAKRILAACQRRKRELIVPARAKILFALSQLFPGLGDWLIRRMTK